MEVDIEALKRKWASEIEQVKREGAAESAVWVELRTNAVALYAELQEAERTNDCARAIPIMAALAETNAVIDAMNLVGIASILRGYELVRKLQEENEKCSKLPSSPESSKRHSIS